MEIEIELGVKVGETVVSKKGQSSLSVVIPKQVVNNLKISKGDIAEFYQNPSLGNNVVILIFRKKK